MRTLENASHAVRAGRRWPRMSTVGQPTQAMDSARAQDAPGAASSSWVSLCDSKSLPRLACVGAAAIGHPAGGRRGKVATAGTRLQITREKKVVLISDRREGRP